MDNKIVFIRDLEHSNPSLNSKTKHENHKSVEKYNMGHIKVVTQLSLFFLLVFM